MAGDGGRARWDGGRGEMMGHDGAVAEAAARSDDGIYYVTPADDKGQYKILPVLITVLIDQDHVQDLLVELENSPMSIQVKDFELERPSPRSPSPRKASSPAAWAWG